MYSTWRSGESAGYCDFNRLTLLVLFCVKGPSDGLLGDCALLVDPPLLATLFGGIRGAPDSLEVVRERVELSELWRA